MRILMINVVCGIRSTGRICTDLAIALEEHGHEVKIAYGRDYVPPKFQKYAVKIGTDFDVKLHVIKARILDAAGFASKRATKQFIKWVKEYNPDVIHLHNIHGYYINVEVLFEYLKTCKKKIIWTLHDCWAFTGHCTYFEYVQCNKWQEECRQCLQKKEYPSCIGVCRANYNFKRKRNLFTNIPNMQVITPSYWLAHLVKLSYMKEYSVNVIHNGIDTSVFKPVCSNLRYKYHLENLNVILGVAAIWNKRKGLEFFEELSHYLDDSYKIVVIGVTPEQKKRLPNNIIGIGCTNRVQELAEWYSVADVVLNPTLEDNYPTINIEALACGTPVITFPTGGSPEAILPEMQEKLVTKEKTTNAIIKLLDQAIQLFNEKKIIKSYGDIMSKEKAVLQYIELIENGGGGQIELIYIPLTEVIAA